MEGLPDERELHGFEVTKPAVQQFRRPTRRAGGKVALLNQTSPKPAGGGIQRAADAGNSPTNDQDVEVLVGETFKIPSALMGVQRIWHDLHLHGA